jgi:hypothetical protein
VKRYDPRRHDPPPIQSTNGVEKRALDAQAKVKVPGVFVANTTFSMDVDGVAYVIHKGRDRVREGHPLLEANPQYFDAVELGIAYDTGPEAA